ncbi:MAG: 2-phosphosulfolactate phosphatase [Bacteroidia bacterium]
MSKKVEVCFSPFHIPLYELTKKAVVVIDVYRATSAIVAGLGSGIEKIIPVSTVDEAKEYKAKGYIAAAERKGDIVKGFDIGNSPLAFSKSDLKGKTVVLSTSNGTKALIKAKNAKEIVVGSFLNLSAVVNYINEQHDSVMFLAAGWRDRFNLEDTIVAGAMAQRLIDLGWQTDCDSCLASSRLYDMAKPNVKDFMKNASHTNRLAHLHLEDDIAYCNKVDEFNLVPIYNQKTGEITVK